MWPPWSDSRPETATARRIVLDVPTWPGNDAGSHLDVRLTAPDGYQATRSYSIASAGEGTRVVLAVDELPDGEVSPFLVHDLRAGDQLELHGPLGAFFVWTPPSADVDAAPGAADRGRIGRRAAVRDGRRRTPRRAIRRRSGCSTRCARPTTCSSATSCTSWPPPRRPCTLDLVFTRRTPDGWPTAPARLTRERLDEAAVDAASRPQVYVCGPTPFVEAVAGWLIDAGHLPGDVRTERFGGS